VKSLVLNLAKYAIPIAIVVWLLWKVPEEQYRELQQHRKNVPLLLAAAGVVLAAVSLTFVRWYLLVRALDLRFRLRDAFRLGFLGYLLNFVSVGAVGGDLFKAVFIAREQAGRRAEAVATVVVDRVAGLFGLLLISSGAVLVASPPDPAPDVVAIQRVTLIFTLISCVGLATLSLPAFTGIKVATMLGRLPKIGTVLERWVAALRAYRSRWTTLLLSVVISMCTHMMFVVSLFLISHAMFDAVPSFREHMIIVPLGMVAGALPFTPAGFGAFELAIEELYKIVPAAAASDVSGILVALSYRLITILIAMLGVVVYWFSRRELREVMEDAQQEA
jgi:uncharacterized protein (TIRG00374 family)